MCIPAVAASAGRHVRRHQVSMPGSACPGGLGPVASITRQTRVLCCGMRARLRGGGMTGPANTGLVARVIACGQPAIAPGSVTSTANSAVCRNMARLHAVAAITSARHAVLERRGVPVNKVVA